MNALAPAPAADAPAVEGELQGVRKGNREYTLTERTIAEDKALIAIAEGHVGIYAAKHAGIPYSTLLYWKQTSEEFAGRWAEAYEHGTQRLEQIAMKRAEEQSDTMLIFLLKARRPEVYGTTHHRHAGAAGGPIQITAVDAAL